MLEGGLKSKKNGLAMGLIIWGDAEESVKNTYLLAINTVRLLQKIGIINLMNQTRFKNIMARKHV